MTPPNSGEQHATQGAAAASDLPPGLGKPAEWAFAAAGYTRLEHFTQVSEAELLKLHGVGRKAVAVLRRTLAAQGRAFADETPGKV